MAGEERPAVEENDGVVLLEHPDRRLLTGDDPAEEAGAVPAVRQ
jgi:hypothetical protein